LISSFLEAYRLPVIILSLHLARNEKSSLSRHE
jgi:hypothetical protein